jgi:hypothetical protein
MRRFVVALACGVFIALALVAPGPADATGRHWHTVLGFHHTKAQACLKSGVLYVRVNNRHGGHDARVVYTETFDGSRTGGSAFDLVAKHTVSHVVGGTVQGDRLSVRIKLFGGGKKHGSLAVAKLGLC